VVRVADAWQVAVEANAETKYTRRNLKKCPALSCRPHIKYTGMVRIKMPNSW
jgi:hypothetical protein